MNKLILTAALTACLSTPCLAATKADAMKWEAGYLALSAVDAAETIHCLDQHQCTEANPLFGKHPSAAKLIAGKIVLGGLHFLTVNRISNHNPKAAMRIAQFSVGLQGGVVLWNARIFF